MLKGSTRIIQKINYGRQNFPSRKGALIKGTQDSLPTFFDFHWPLSDNGTGHFGTVSLGTGGSGRRIKVRCSTVSNRACFVLFSRMSRDLLDLSDETVMSVKVSPIFILCCSLLAIVVCLWSAVGLARGATRGAINGYAIAILIMVSNRKKHEKKH